jgi:histidine phosphatase superfamily protein (branch 1)
MRSPTLLRWLVAGVLSAALAGCATDRVQSRPGTTTTVILTRHADTDPGFGELNGTGCARAQALVDTVGAMRITAIYSPNLERNLDTVRPLASRLGIEITRTAGVSVFAADSIAREMLDQHAGGVVLWVGNVSGNLQAIYCRLGGTGMGPVEYGDLHILTIPDRGPVGVVKTRYGPQPGP